MNYWTIPGEALETPVEVQPWGRLALADAVRGRKPKKPLARK
jgi:TfoX/Sxy family transcriptional regulator of competence genes